MSETHMSLLKYGYPMKVQENQNTNYLAAEDNDVDSNELKLEEALRAVHVDKEWMIISPENGEKEMWKQSLSKEPAGEDDVINLSHQFEQILLEKKARLFKPNDVNNICEIREETYDDCFDEICRQVVIENPEQGQLLTRVRNEVRLTIDAQKTLYYNSLLLNMKKEINQQQQLQQDNYDAKCALLISQNTEFENEIAELQAVLETIEKADADRKNMEEKKHKEEMEYLRYQQQQLDNFLKQLTALNLGK